MRLCQPIFVAQETDAKRLRQQVSAAKKAGDLSVAPVWAGTSVGLIKSIEPAEQLISRMVAELASILTQSSRMLQANGGA